MVELVLPANVLPSLSTKPLSVSSFELVMYCGSLSKSNSSTLGTFSRTSRAKLYTPVRGSRRKWTPGLNRTRSSEWARVAIGTLPSGEGRGT